MQIMARKGLVSRDESKRTHIYRPAVDRAETQRGLVGRLMRRAFEGSAAKLVQSALDAGDGSPTEVEEIRRLLDEYEERHR